MTQTKTNRVQITLLVALLLLVLGAGIFFFLHKQAKSGLEMEPNATVGILPGVDLEERRLQLQQLLDDSQIAFSINSSPTFDTGSSEGNLMLENPGNNAKLITAQIVLEESGETVYESKAIAPGTYLENIKLTKPLKKGSYPATVYLRAYREDTQELIGQTGAAITLTVLA